MSWRGRGAWWWLRILIGVAWAMACWAQVDPLVLGRPAQRLFTDRDGLPQNTIEGILIDAKGYLWVATQDGPARYNGRSWEALIPPEAKGNLWIRCMMSRSDGSLWFGRFVGGVWNIGTANGPSTASPTRWCRPA